MKNSDNSIKEITTSNQGNKENLSSSQQSSNKDTIESSSSSTKTTSITQTKDFVITSKQKSLTSVCRKRKISNIHLFYSIIKFL